ncbi:hypothetical protein NLI96_g5859 [Meripilus lineatus]|uniref:Uncharacterized protein n=1 Tax=Meripilus lineatus TaxID=2056292 RepID=A0AAD5V2T4_9APHY|nr:hypothetical protein NLI96_g5859 [Physisporinus lineatus]
METAGDTVVYPEPHLLVIVLSLVGGFTIVDFGPPVPHFGVLSMQNKSSSSLAPQRATDRSTMRFYSSTSTPGLGIEPFTPGIQSRSQDNGPFDIPSKEQIRGMVGPATFAGAPSCGSIQPPEAILSPSNSSRPPRWTLIMTNFGHTNSSRITEPFGCSATPAYSP